MECAELIDALLRSVGPNVEEGIADAWKTEAESRIDAFDAGDLTGNSAETMLASIDRP